MSDVVLYLFVAFGVLVSLVIPILWKAAFPPGGSRLLPLSFWTRLWKIAEPYLLMGILSLLLGLVTFAVLKSVNAELKEWYHAFLNGYFWDATIQKFQRST